MDIFDKKIFYFLNQTEKSNLDKDHQKILNYLLDIKKNDIAVNFKLSKYRHSVDLINFVSVEKLEKLYKKNTFKVDVTFSAEKIFKNLIFKDFFDFENFVFANKIFIKEQDMEFLKKDFSANFPVFLKRKEKEKINLLSFWKSTKNRINLIFNETDVWPSFVGYYFVHFYSKEKNINFFGPLLIKEVNVLIENNKAFLVSENSTLKINEKLRFLIYQISEFEFPLIDEKVTDVSFFDAEQELNKLFSKSNFFNPNFEIKKIDQQILQSFSNNENFIFEKKNGFAFFLGNPLGSKVKNSLQKLMNVEFNQQNYDFLKTTDIFENYEKKAEQEIFDQKKMIRISPMDFSQEKAVVSCLNNSGIIFGPPGTGKSQTIANLIANIFYRNESALIISQKKTAINVVLKRLGKLENLVLNMSFKLDWKIKNFDLEIEKFFQKFKNIIDYIKNNFDKEREIVSEEKPFLLDCWKELIEVVNRSFENKKEYEKLIKIFRNEQQENQDNVFVFLENIFISFNKIKSLFEDVENLKKYIENYDEKDKLETAKKLNGLKIKLLKIYKSKFEVKYNFLKENLKKYKKSTLINIAEIKDEKVFSTINKKIKTFNSINKEKNQTFLNSIENVYQKAIKEICLIFMEMHKNSIPEFSSIIKKISSPNPKRINISMFINRHRNILKKIFKVFSGTAESLANFIDFNEDKFDYIIFDEASQIPYQVAFLYLLIGKKIIIAGDNQQLKPIKWFTRNFAEGDEDEESEMDLVDSLLDFAIQNRLPENYLKMNYRSKSAQLVTFSSKHFYESNLKSLDDIKKNENSFEVYNVNGIWNNGKNKEEIIAILNYLNNLNFSQYGSVMILFFNEKQMVLFEDMISRSEKWNNVLIPFEEGKLEIKNFESMQGDEADLVIVSVSYTKDTKLNSTYIGKNFGKNALNVAITRAKNKMVVFKSIKSEEIKTYGKESLVIFKKWIKFLDLTETEKTAYDIKDKILDSEKENSDKIEKFKKWFIEHFAKYSYKISWNLILGSYRVDFCVYKNDAPFLLIDVLNYNRKINVDEMFFLKQKIDFLKSKGYKFYLTDIDNLDINYIKIKEEIFKILVN